jgi:hypothetical protein
MASVLRVIQPKSRHGPGLRAVSPSALVVDPGGRIAGQGTGDLVREAGINRKSKKNSSRVVVAGGKFRFLKSSERI